jgi:flagellar biosynthesis protein
MDGRAGLRRKAVALLYREGIPAPLVAAKGEGRAAELILDIAREKGVPIVEDEAAEALFPLGIGEYIPERFFEAVALILAAVIGVEGGK